MGLGKEFFENGLVDCVCLLCVVKAVEGLLISEELNKLVCEKHELGRPRNFVCVVCVHLLGALI